MSQDIVERLRGRHECAMNAHGYDLKLHYEAADTIESLRARVAELEALCAENNGIIQRMGIGIKDKDRLIAQLVRDAEMYGPNKLAIEKQAWVMADSVREIRELRDQLAAQALTIKTMREALNIWINIAANCSIESGCCCCGESMKNHSHPMSCGHSPVDMADSIAYEAIAETDKALALPDNSTEILQEWLDKQLGEPRRSAPADVPPSTRPG